MTGRYKKWGIIGSDIIHGSYILPRRDSPKKEIDQAWKLGGHTCIVQSESKSEWPDLVRYVRTFYEAYGSHYPRMVVVDELADFYEQRVLGDIFQRIARNGRERDICFIAGSQRPRKVPVEIMTEFLRLYLFQLDYIEDMQHIVEFGLPWTGYPKKYLGDLMPKDHAFFMWDRKLRNKEPSGKYYILDFRSQK